MADKTLPNPLMRTSISFGHQHSHLPTSSQQSNPLPPRSESTTTQIMSTVSSNTTTTAAMHPKTSHNSISSLMSPPEAAPYESFSRSSPEPSTSSRTPERSLSRFPPSPPVSPYPVRALLDERHGVENDPILYPSHHGSAISSPPQRSLFSDGEEESMRQRILEAHMAARDGMIHVGSPPRKEDYSLALEFKSRVLAACDENRPRWINREKTYLLNDQKSRTDPRQLPPIAPRPLLAAKTVVRTSTSKPAKLLNARAPRTQNTKPAKVRSAPRDPNVPHEKPTRTPTVSTREDRDFNALPDFCPPLSSLPNRPNSLKVEWKGAPIDLRGDPHRHLLHPDEVTLAANLRLDCATYLTSKRRIFQARVNALRIRKEFRKTDSQQACKIDVNKASKLWMAFEKVGWLDARHFKNFLV